jgi:hypothetical protein
MCSFAGGIAYHHICSSAVGGRERRSRCRPNPNTDGLFEHMRKATDAKDTINGWNTHSENHVAACVGSPAGYISGRYFSVGGAVARPTWPRGRPRRTLASMVYGRRQEIQDTRTRSGRNTAETITRSCYIRSMELMPFVQRWSFKKL